MAVSKKAPALKKRQRAKLDDDLESGPAVDQRRDDIMRNMLALPPKHHADMKLGKQRQKSRTAKRTEGS